MKEGSSGQKEGQREIELDGITAEQMNSVIENTHIERATGTGPPIAVTHSFSVNQVPPCGTGWISALIQ